MINNDQNEDTELTNLIASRVSVYDIRSTSPYPETDEGDKRAAVLLPLTVKNGDVHILLTKRSSHLRSHPGSVSFPGGKRDDTDHSDVQTALREAEEEIGLPPDSVRVLGILSRGITLPNTVVYPVVGLIPNDFKPRINPTEVEFAFYMPLKDFLDENKVMLSKFDIRGRPFLSRSVVYEDEEKSAKVWGFTANYCTVLAKIVFDQVEFFPMFCDSKLDKGKGLVHDLEEYFKHVKSSLSTRSMSKL